MVAIEEYLKLREKPKGFRVMYQKWRDLTFLHYSIEPEWLRGHVPPELDIDTFPNANGEERAWVGLIPFWMTGVRARFFPPTPGLHQFAETNVRTYVHRNGKEPGVWFFSLDAANRLACAIARLTYGLPYYFADMTAQRVGNAALYKSKREIRSATCKVCVEVGDEIGEAQPGTLEFFLIERYLLYSRLGGRLAKAQVHHPPYTLYQARYDRGYEGLIGAAGIIAQPWENCVYSPGVDVDVYAIRKT